MKTNNAATPTDANRAGRLLGKFSNQSVKIVTAGRCYQTASMDRADDEPPIPDRARPSAGAPAVTRFERVGRWSARHRWPVVITWGVLILVAVPLALQTPGALRSGGFIRDDLESAQAKALLETEIGVPEAALVIVLHSDTARAGEPEFEIAAATALADVPQAEFVRSVIPHALSTRQVSADGHTAYDIVLLNLSADDSPEALPGIRAAIRDVPGLDRLSAHACPECCAIFPYEEQFTPPGLAPVDAGQGIL